MAVHTMTLWTGRRLAAAMVVTSVCILTACGGTGMTSAALATTTTTVSGAAVAGTSTCPASAVKVTVQTGVSLGHDGVNFHISAPGTSCTITGFPSVAVYSGQFKGYRTSAVSQSGAYLESVSGAPPVVSLADSAVASSILEGDSVAGGTCHQIASAVVTVRSTASGGPIRVRVTFPMQRFCGETWLASCFARAQQASRQKKSAPSCGRPVVGPWVPGTEYVYPPGSGH